MTTKKDLENLKVDLSVKSKNGIDFIISASIIWLVIAGIWTLDFTAYNKSVFTFFIGSLVLPLALLFSKILKTNWKNKENPLQPLGLWLNFAQMFYFPFLLFVFFKIPDYFVMTYCIITGAHFFPYAWFYKVKWYAVFAGIIAVGALFIGLKSNPDEMFIIPLFTSICLLLLAILLHRDYKNKIINPKN